MTHLNDLSKAYLDQIAEKKKDDTYLEPDMKKRQANNEKARKELAKGPQMKNPHFEEKKLDPVGQEDGDVDNDGDKDSSDKYLMKRRKAIAKAMKKESFVKSDWRNSISEVMNDIESQPIKEKKVKNKVVINPKMSEAVEEIGGTLIEEIEVDDIEGIVECVYGELIEEGYTEDEVESAIEQSLTEAKITYGHDTSGGAESMRDKLKKKAKGFLGKVAVKAYNKAREAKVAATPAVQRAKTSAKRGIKKMAQKVVDRMSEEIVGEAVYGGTKKPEPTDKRLTVTNADKAGNTPAYQKYKAGDKNYKAADHMKEEQVDEEKKPLPKTKMFRKAGNLGRDAISTPIDPEKRQKAYDRSKKIIKTLNQNEEVEQVDEAGRMHSASAQQAGFKRIKDKESGGPGVGKVRSDDEIKKEKGGQAFLDRIAKAKAKMNKEEVEVAEADSLAAMQARREKRLAAQRKKMGTSSTGQDFGHDHGISSAERKKRQQAEFDKFVGKKTQKEEASMSPQEVQLQKKKAMLDKMIATKRMQGLKNAKKSEAPTKAMGEGLSIDQQMKISRDHNRKSPEEKKAANMKALSGLKKGTPKKDTRTDAQKMTDATGPRPGSRYRGD